MVTLHNLTLTVIDGKYYVSGYSEPERSCSGKPDCIRCLDSRCKYLIWKESKQTYPVDDESKKLFNEELICEDFKNLEVGYPVDISSLADRIEIKKWVVKMGDLEGPTIYNYEARLLSAKQEVDNIDYRALLESYVMHVVYCDGSNFLKQDSHHLTKEQRDHIMTFISKGFL